MIKIVWALIGLNTTALLIFITMFFADSQGRNVDSMEKGWTIILVIVGLVVIALPFIPLRISHSTFSIGLACFLAALPLLIVSVKFLSKKLPSFKKEQTLAEIYYSEKPQRLIAAAIEQHDTVLLKEAIKGHDLNIQGNRVWDWPGLNYVQFTIRIWDKEHAPEKEAVSLAAIELLLQKGCKPTPALSEAAMKQLLEPVRLLLDAGADPNTHGYANNDPVLFESIGTQKVQNDIAILLVQKGADVNAKASNNYDLTPVMYAANNARTSSYWNDSWRLVRFLLEDAHCDFKYITKYGESLQAIIRRIRADAVKEAVIMAPDFDTVVNWLEEKGIDTTPVKTDQ